MRTKFTTDDRGVSEVIGAILVFGLLIALIAILQTQAVPAANQEVEFNHNQDVQSDLVKFHETMSSVAATGTQKSTQIRMGTTYPSRMLFFNPPSPAGEVRVAGDDTGQIRNVSAVDGDIRDYMDGSTASLQMKRLEYHPRYNEYENPPTTVLEYGIVYSDFGDQVTVDNPGQVINGNTVSLTFFNGNMSRTSAGSLSLDAQATSAPARTVTVTNSSGGPIVLELPTNLNASYWDEILSEEENVEDVRSGGAGKVEIELNSSKSYNLRMAQIGIGSGVPTPEAHYVTRASNRQLQVGEANQLPIEVRDRYNNPVSGATLNITVEEGEFQNGQKSIQTTTTEEGRPAARYFGNGAGVDVVRASISNDATAGGSFDDDRKEDVQFNVTFDPRLDNQDPQIDSLSVTEENYQVCTAFTEIGLVGTSLLGCSTASTASQIVVDYESSDSGGSGLEYMKIDIKDSSGNTIMNSTNSLRGASAEGTFVSSQIVHSELASPATVEIYFYDRNGNFVSQTSSL